MASHGCAHDAQAEEGNCCHSAEARASFGSDTTTLVSIRIGLICPYSLTVPGGVQAQVLGLARELRARGHEARVLAPCDGPPPELFVTPLGASVPASANGSVAPLAPDPAAALRTIRALRDEDFDILHLHEPLAPGPTLTALTVKPVPIVATFHAAGDSTLYRVLNSPVRWFADRIDVRIAVSDDAEELAKRYLGGEYEILYNGVELVRYHAVQPMKVDQPTIFFCGRHEPRKGLETLLRAMAFLPSDVQLWIGSQGPETARLTSMFAGDARLHWLGFLPEAEKIARMAGASVYCAPSTGGESFGVVLIEAMAAGCPVVASDIDGYRNVATHDVDAVLTAIEDPEALGRALLAVLSDRQLAERLRVAGRQRANHFSMSVLASRYEEIYDEARRSPARTRIGGLSSSGALRRLLTRR